MTLIRDTSLLLPSVVLHHLPLETITALAAGDRELASSTSGQRITSYLAQDRALWVWQLTVAADVDTAGRSRWLACAVLDHDLGAVVGHAGFHGPPREGMVEIGYSIDPAYRRRGYGRAVVRALLAEARTSPEIDRVRASIDATNTASLATIAGLGFAVVGERPVDGGHERILERPIPRPR